MWLFLAFLAVPLIEIGLFVEVGGAIGLWATLAWVLLSAVIGVLVIRKQGMARAAELRGGLRGIDPLSPLAMGVLAVLAGFLLILPGFLTDTLGLILLIPPVRRGLVALLARRMTVVGAGFAGSTRRADTGIIDGEFQDVTPDTAPEATPRPGLRGPSGWTNH